MKKRRKRWLGAVLTVLMLVVSICTDAGLYANAATKKGAGVSIVNLPQDNTLSLDPEDKDTCSYRFKAKTSGADVVYFEVKQDTNTAGVNSSKSGNVYPATAGSFEIRAIAFTSAKNRDKWLDARRANGNVADPEAEKYAAAATDWTTITVVVGEENEGIGIARSQGGLNKVLRNKNVKNVVILTDAEREFTIADKNYKSKTLTVKAPNAEVINAGRFAMINVEQIKTSTFFEKAKGNRFHVSALNARIVVEKEARVLGLTYQPKVGKGDVFANDFFNFNLVVRGILGIFDIAPQKEESADKIAKPAVKMEVEKDAAVSQVKISEPSDVTVAGENEEPVKVTVDENAAGTVLNAETPVKAELSSDTVVNLAEGAKNSSLSVTKKADVEVRAENPVSDVTVKVAKTAKGAKISLFVKVVIEISADIVLTGTAVEDSTVVVTDKDVTVTDENGNVIEADNTAQDTTGEDSSAPVTPDTPVPPLPAIPEFSGKLIWTVGDSENGTITKDSPNPLTIKLSEGTVSGSAIDFSLFAADKANFSVSADKSHLDGATTEVKVTVKYIHETDRVVAEYTILFTLEPVEEEPSEQDGLPVIKIENNKDNPITADFDSITVSKMEQTAPDEYEVTITVPELRKFGELWYTISAKGYGTRQSTIIAQLFNGANGPELIFPDYTVKLEGQEDQPEITITIHVVFHKLSADSPEWDVHSRPNLKGSLVVTGSAVTVSGSAITVIIGDFGNEDQTMEFTTNEDGSITGEFSLKVWRAPQVLRVSLGTEGITSNKEVEYIWKRDGKVIKYDMFNLADMEGLSPEGEKIITYSVTIKAKQTE